MTKSLLKYVLFLFGCSQLTNAQQTIVNVFPNINHVVGDVTEFDRQKYITIHSSLLESDWTGEEDKLAYLLDDLDVYLGRNNGTLGWYMNQSKEDPNRPGFVDPNYMNNRGRYVRETVYGKNSLDRHQYEYKADVMIGGQERPFWPGTLTNPCCDDTAYEIASAEAIGDFMGRFLNTFYRNNNQTSTKGLPRPRFLEIINEPIYGLVTNGEHTNLEVFEFHNDVANAIRQHNTETLIGGYTAAFPVFDVDNFENWEKEMKLFIDTSGENMDYFSVHFYDFNKHHFNNGRRFDGPINFKGSRMEATLDMMEHYSKLALDEVKPYLISEYGGRDHSNEWKPWSADRDWSFMKSYSPLMLHYMKRPDRILKTIPFIVTKAEWGRTNVPYAPRLMRQAFEAEGETGEHWVFSGLVKFYELWANVKGKRTLTQTNNKQLLTDSYVHNNKLYIIASNLNFDDEELNINLNANTNNIITNITAKHLYGNTNGHPVIENSVLTPESEISFNLHKEATAIIEVCYQEPITVNETVNEQIHYATSYKKSIIANTPISFTFSQLNVSENSYGKLRIGIGRVHGKELYPMVKLNGTVMTTPTTYAGDAQTIRDSFFGLLEISIPEDQLQTNNTLELLFSDSGGFVSSAAIQIYNPSTKIETLSNTLTPVASNSKIISVIAEQNILRVMIPENKKTQIQIADIKGHILLSTNIEENNTNFSTTKFTKGIYIVSIHIDNTTYSKKISL